MIVLLVVIAVVASGGSRPPNTTSNTTTTATDQASTRNGLPATSTTTTTPIQTTTSTAVVRLATTTTAVPRTTVPPTTTTTIPPTTTAPAGHSCSASMTNSSPADYTEDTVSISSNVPDAPVLITKNYKTTTSTDTGETDSGGSASISFDDSGATVGYPVQVNVSINNGEATCSTSFTPQ